MIDLQTAIYIWETYGWLGILSLTFGLYIVYDRIVSNKKKKRIAELEQKVETIEGKVDNMHEGCSVPQGSIKKLYQKIGDLETKDTTIDGDIREFKAEVRAELKHLRGGQKSMQTGIDSIISHLMKG